MFNGMMDPEFMRLAQEQMSRIPPEELARMQQQVLSNPELVKLATESMKNLTTEDVRRATEQLKHTRPEEMAEVREKLAKATPEELASMKAQADARVTYELNASKRLKQQGNELHSRGQYQDAANKYFLAKSNLKNIPSGMGRTLLLQCSLNLMSCYLKTGQFQDCIKEGSEVLAYDLENVKAFYRRGQAYKEVGNLEAAVSDLKKAHQISPDDETIADVLRDAEDLLITEKGPYSTRRGLVIEEIVEEENQSSPSDGGINLRAAESSVTIQAEPGETSQGAINFKHDAPTNEDLLKKIGDDPESIRFFQNYVSSADPATLDAMGLGGLPPDMIKSTAEMISKMKPEELQQMLKSASSLSGKSADKPMTGSKYPEINPEMVKMASDTFSKMSPEEMQDMIKVASSMNMNAGDNPRAGSQYPEINPEMVKMASDTFSKMSPEQMQEMFKVASSMNMNAGVKPRAGSQYPEINPEMAKMASDTFSKMSPEQMQEMLKVASSLNMNGSPFSNAMSNNTTQTSEDSYTSSSSREFPSSGESSSRDSILNSRIGQPSSSLPTSATDLQESMRNSMKDPAMRQMFTTMMKNMSPEMMASMGEQFGMKMSKEDAAKAHEAMSKLSPEDLDRMMHWADKLQRGVETAKRTKNWLLGRSGLILAIVMLILAFILHQLGFIGG